MRLGLFLIVVVTRRTIGGCLADVDLFLLGCRRLPPHYGSLVVRGHCPNDSAGAPGRRLAAA